MCRLGQWERLGHVRFIHEMLASHIESIVMF